MLIPDGDHSESLLMHALVEQEMKEVCDLLEALSTRMVDVCAWLATSRVEAKEENGDEASLAEQVRSVSSAIHLVGVHRISSCIAFLRQWEVIDCPGGSTFSTAMKHWWLEVQQFRPILHRSLRLLGEEPHGFATYHFLDNKKQRVALPEHMVDRRARMQRLSREMSAEQVLQLLGSPDHLRIQPHWDGRTNRWGEDWEYDFLIAS